ncbi:hypothetical protein [Streptomyces sp. NPDC060243]|uniref:hypothetical protein n=1 Tax=Streptomyces sp. NPDC060243 TaxID=3347081 RepID=UPI00365CC16E
MTDDRRDRIAQALEREDARNWGYDHGFENRYGVDEETDAFVDAVLAVLPVSADRAAVLREAAEQVRQPLTPEESRLAQRTWGHVPLQELLARRIDPQGTEAPGGDR